MLTLSTPEAANTILMNGLVVCQKRVYTEKCWKEPIRARHESGYLRRYPRVHPWENPCKRITCVRVTRRLQNPRVRVSVLDHTQPVQVTRTTRVYFSKHSRATTTTRRCLAHARHPRHCCCPRL